MLTSLALVNELALDHVSGRRAPAVDLLEVLVRVLAVDPPSVAQLAEDHVPGFVALAHRLRTVFGQLNGGNIDAAAHRLNELLSAHSAHPHLAKEAGVWRLHHHPVDADLIPMWTSICAEGVARMIGDGLHDRFGTCEAADCERVYFDSSKNASRRFCSTTCQNRTKTAAFRLRRAATARRNGRRRLGR